MNRQSAVFDPENYIDILLVIFVFFTLIAVFFNRLDYFAALITLLGVYVSAKFAYGHYLKQERDKVQQERIKAINRLLHAIIQRYKVLSTIKSEYLKAVGDNTSFMRTINISRDYMETNVDTTSISDTLFLSSLFDDYKECKISDIPQDIRVCEPIFIDSVLSNYDLLIYNWEKRHKEMDDLFNLLGKRYSGNGMMTFSFKEIRGDVPFSRFSNILNFNEKLIQETESSLLNIVSIIRELPYKASPLFSSEQLSLIGGIINFKFSDEDLVVLDAKIKPLPDEQYNYLNGIDYPEFSHVPVTHYYCDYFYTPDVLIDAYPV